MTGALSCQAEALFGSLFLDTIITPYCLFDPRSCRTSLYETGISHKSAEYIPISNSVCLAVSWRYAKVYVHTLAGLPDYVT